MDHSPVNCGRCAHLWTVCQNQPGRGVCACTARQLESGAVRPTVDLAGTCAHAKLSAQFDPDFIPRVLAARRAAYPCPSILTDAERLKTQDGKAQDQEQASLSPSSSASSAPPRFVDSEDLFSANK